VTRIHVPAGTARGVGLTAGQILRIVNVAGAQVADFIARLRIHMHAPVAGGDVARRAGQLFDGTRDARCGPPAQQHRQQHAQAAGGQRNRADEALHLDQVAARAAHQQHA